jgi:hypothetical protein
MHLNAARLRCHESIQRDHSQRFVTRAAALVLLVAAFVGLVYDGTRSIANNELALTPLGGVAFRLFPSSFMKIEPVATALHPMLWDPVLLHFFLVPGCVFGFTLGALLLWAGRKPEEPLHPSPGS